MRPWDNYQNICLFRKHTVRKSQPEGGWRQKEKIKKKKHWKAFVRTNSVRSSAIVLERSRFEEDEYAEIGWKL